MSKKRDREEPNEEFGASLWDGGETFQINPGVSVHVAQHDFRNLAAHRVFIAPSSLTDHRTFQIIGGDRPHLTLLRRVLSGERWPVVESESRSFIVQRKPLKNVKEQPKPTEDLESGRYPKVEGAGGWVRHLTWFLPKQIREPWLGDLLEDRHEMVKEGHGRTYVEAATAWQMVILLGGAVWNLLRAWNPFKGQFIDS